MISTILCHFGLKIFDLALGIPLSPHPPRATHGKVSRVSLFVMTRVFLCYDSLSYMVWRSQTSSVFFGFRRAAKTSFCTLVRWLIDGCRVRPCDSNSEDGMVAETTVHPLMFSVLACCSRGCETFSPDVVHETAARAAAEVEKNKSLRSRHR